MIVTLYLGILLTFIGYFFSIFPAGGTLPTAYTDFISTLSGTLKAWDFILPWSAIWLSLGVSFAWTAFILVWDLVHWVIKKIPFVSMR